MTNLLDNETNTQPDILESYAAQFKAERIAGEPSWLAPLRQAALSRFRELGFPTRRDEEWRFTPVGPIVEIMFTPAPSGLQGVTRETLAPFTFGGETATQLVFVNGRYAPELSAVSGLPEGVFVGSLAEAFRTQAAALEPNLARRAKFDKAAFVALNTAMLEDGAAIILPRNAVVEQPIHVLFVSAPAALDGTADATPRPTVSHPRVLIVAGESSSATIIETYTGTGDSFYFTNAVTEVVAEQNAQIDHYKVQRESPSAYHIATMQVEMARTSVFSSHSIGLGGQIVRNDANAALNGEGIECTLNGLYFGSERRLIDNHTAIDHAMPHCNSHELYKGILGDRSRGVFNGKIFVQQDAQKTDAKQTNQTLLLSNDAQINTKPQLEIFADDVKCTHGATIGQLDANALFYLRSRGIGEAEARSLLIYAFAGDIIQRIKVEPVREQLNDLLLAALPKP